MVEYNHNNDIACNFGDFMGPFSMIVYLLVLIMANIVFLIGLYEVILEHSSIIEILTIFVPLLLFSFFLYLFIKEGGGLYPLKLFFEHILYFSISDNEILIKYTENGFDRKYIQLNKQDISKFLVNYTNVRTGIQRVGKYTTITYITATIEIETFDGNNLKIKSSGGILGLIKFLCKNGSEIPNFSYYTENDDLKEYLSLFQKK